MIYLVLNEDGTPHKAYENKNSAQSRVSNHGGVLFDLEVVKYKGRGSRPPKKFVLLDLMTEEEIEQDALGLLF